MKKEKERIYALFAKKNFLIQIRNLSLGSGWPSFFASIENKIIRKEDRSFGMIRTEITCRACNAHLGHVFPDGPQPTGERYCVNSLSMDFIADE